MLRHPDAGTRLVDDDVRLILVDGSEDELPGPGSLPVVVGWIGDRLGSPAPMFADLAVGADDVDRLTMTVARNPVASTSLAVLLRSIEYLPVDLGLAAESAVYSMLQTGEEFHRWRGSIESVMFDDDRRTVVVERLDDVLTLTLDRPQRHNAITRRLRDELCDGLRIAMFDDSIEAVHIVGRGDSFCSGGDLGEFGASADSATGHLVRLAQSPALLVHRLRTRTSVSIHGMTLGGGAEIAAFAGHVVADPATRIGLPEIELGLIPGAGGTVGVTRRVGRQRCAALALALPTIDAQTALEWQLVDEIAEVHPPS